VIEKVPDDPRMVKPGVDRDLGAIALKCLEKDPQRRYSSAADLADDLDRWLRGEPTTARQPSLALLTWRWLRYNAAAALGLVLLGSAAGITAVLSMFVVNAEYDAFLYPRDLGPLSPLAWIRWTSHTTAGQLFVYVSAAIFALGIGWLVRAIARPHSNRSALAAGGFVGLVATLASFSILGPGFATAVVGMKQLHPIRDYGRELSGAPTAEMPTVEAKYLEQFLSPDLDPKDASRRQAELDRLRFRATITNRFYSAVVSGGLVLILALILFLGLAIESTWAADTVVRSGRPWLARIVCYLELYLPFIAVVAWFLIVLVLLTYRFQGTTVGGPSTEQLLVPLGLGAALVILAHAGVQCHWRPLVRAAVYIVIGAAIVCVLATF
jgi:hypothetical protein